MEQRVFEVRQVRSFDQVLAATFTFIRILFKPLFRSLLMITGPFLLVIGIIYGFVYSNFLLMAGRPEVLSDGMNNLALLGVQIVIAGLFLIVAMLLLFTAINAFIILYTDSRGAIPTPAETWKKTRQSLGRVIGTGLTLWALAAAAFISLLIFLMVVGSRSTPTILIVLMLMPVAIYLAVALSPVFFVRMQEPLNVFQAMSRSMALVRGYWWQTFGIVFIINIITVILSYTVAIPQVVIVGVQAATGQEDSIMWNTLFIGYTAVSFVISQFASSALFNTAIALQYYSLVERKEAVGLRSRVQDLEQSVPPEGAL